MHDQDNEVTGGVETHAEVHVAAAIDGLGRVLGTEAFPNHVGRAIASC